MAMWNLTRIVYSIGQLKLVLVLIHMLIIKGPLVLKVVVLALREMCHQGI